jgi:hypothetical protein
MCGPDHSGNRATIQFRPLDRGGEKKLRLLNLADHALIKDTRSARLPAQRHQSRPKMWNPGF